MELLNQFWAPRKLYKPCGMFTHDHMVLLLISMCLLSGLLFVSRNISRLYVEKITKIFAILLTILESIKIFFNFYWHYTWINAWFPISFCSIFIYALWLSGFTKGKWKAIGDAFIAGVTIVAGAAYLVFPSTSLMIYPKFHFLSIYSMLFHTLMIYLGIIYLRKSDVKLNWKLYCNFVAIYLFFAVIAIGLNIAYGSNLMILKSPSNIPVPFLHNLYNSAPWGYTGLVFVVYLIVPYWVTAFFINTGRKSESYINAPRENELFPVK